MFGHLYSSFFETECHIVTTTLRSSSTRHRLCPGTINDELYLAFFSSLQINRSQPKSSDRTPSCTTQREQLASGFEFIYSDDMVVGRGATFIALRQGTHEFTTDGVVSDGNRYELNNQVLVFKRARLCNPEDNWKSLILELRPFVQSRYILILSSYTELLPLSNAKICEKIADCIYVTMSLEPCTFKFCTLVPSHMVMSGV